MASSPSPFSLALTALGTAIAGLGPGLQAIAGTAASAQATANAAIPKSLAGTTPGDVVLLDASGRLPAVDGSQLVNLPSPHGISPVLQIELGNSGQANNQRGIDQGSWYQLDCSIGTASYNGFQYTTNADGSITIPGGLYLVCCGAKILGGIDGNTWLADTYQLPAQLTIAAGQAYPFPGIYQYAVQRFPDSPVGSITTAGVIGYATFAGVAAWGGSNPLWLGFSKVQGTIYQIPLLMQGYLSIVKIG